MSLKKLILASAVVGSMALTSGSAFSMIAGSGDADVDDMFDQAAAPASALANPQAYELTEVEIETLALN